MLESETLFISDIGVQSHPYLRSVSSVLLPNFSTVGMHVLLDMPEDPFVSSWLACPCSDIVKHSVTVII